MGNDERVTAETALRIGLVTEVVAPRRSSGTRAHEIAAAHRRASRARRRRARCAPSGSRSTARTGAAMQQGLIYTRVGNPIGAAEVAEKGADRPSRGSADRAEPPPALSRLHRRGARPRPVAPRALEFERPLVHVGRPGGDGRRGRAARRARASGSAVAAAQPARPGRPAPRPAAGRRLRGHRQPRARHRPGAGRPRRRSTSARSPASRADLEALAAARCRWLASDAARRRRPTSTRRERDRAHAPTGPSAAGGRGRDAHQRHDRPAEAGAAHLRDAVAGARRRQALRAQPGSRRAAALGRGHRQLAARPPRRAVPRSCSA